MSDPYRDADPSVCPACAASLRTFHDRLCCDACGGMMLELDDLATAVTEIVGDEPALKLVGGHPGTRACPRCRHPMSTCHLEVDFADHPSRLAPTLDCCRSHGIWFDTDELATILAALYRSTEPPSHATLRQIARTLLENYGHKILPRSPPLRV